MNKGVFAGFHASFFAAWYGRSKYVVKHPWFNIGVFVFIFLYSTTIEARSEWILHHYNNENGLSNNSVTCILQDRKGFMWFGTKNGLNRFDGQEFKTYVYSGLPGGLCNSIIYDLSEDADGRIWVATADGISIYYPELDYFYNFNELGFTEEDIKGLIWEIEIGSDDCIWILAQNNVFTLEKGLFIDITQRVVQFMGAFPEKMFVDKTMAFFGGWDGEVVYYERKSDRFLPVASLPSFIWAINRAGEDKLLMGTHRNGLYLADIKEKTLEHFTFDILSNDEEEIRLYPDLTDREYFERAGKEEAVRPDGLFIRCMEQINESEAWIGSEAGLLILRDGMLIRFPQEEIAMGQKMELDIPRTIFRDRDGNVWVGNYFNGIDCFSPNRSFFDCYTKLDTNPSRGKRVRCFAEDSLGGLWIGTEDNGLYKYDFQTGTFSHATSSDGTVLSGFNVQALTMVSQNELLIASTTVGIIKLNVQTGRLSYLIDNVDVYSVFTGKTGRLWAGIRFGLSVYNDKTRCFEAFEPEIRNLSNCIFEDAHGDIWVTALDQVCHINSQTWEKEVFQYKKDDSSSLCYGRVTCGATDGKGRVWLGFEEGGLCRFNEESHSFSRFTLSDGLPTNSIYVIVSDNAGYLWLGTSTGLVHFDPDKCRVIAFYDTNDGLPTKAINYRSGLRLSSGRLVFGTNEGFFIFDPSEVTRQLNIKPITLTGLYLNNEEVIPVLGEEETSRSPVILDKAMPYAEGIRLSHKQSTFSLTFSSLDYANEGRADVSYTLKGFDKDWNYLKNANSVHYHNVTPGRYTFGICMADYNSDEFGPQTYMTIIVTPPWWKTLVARLFFLLLGIGVIVFLAMLFINKRRQREEVIRKEKERKMEADLYQAKIDFFTNIAHEIRTPVSLIKAPLENIMHDSPSKEVVEKDLSLIGHGVDRLLTLTSQLLDFRKIESGDHTLQLKYVDVKKILNDVWSLFLPSMDEKGFEVAIVLPEQPMYSMLDEDATIKVISNLMSNALKYTSSYIHLTLEKDDETQTIRILVNNDGPRIPKEMHQSIFEPFIRVPDDRIMKQGTGIGLSLASNLAQMQGGRLFVNPQAVDNEFVFELPLNERGGTATLIEQSQSPQGTDSVEDREWMEKTSMKTLLIVEDEDELLHFLSAHFSGSYHVLEAKDGIEAEEILRKQIVHLVLSDIMMPRKDGIDLCKDIKTDLETCHIPVVLLTAKSTIDDLLVGLEQGADAYIEKPFSLEHVRKQIENLLANRQRIIEKYAREPFIHSESIAQSTADKQFIQEVTTFIVENMEDPNLSIDVLAEKMFMSRSTLHRKIKVITDKTPNDFVRLIRLKRAAELLASGMYKASEVCEMVGYSSFSWFNKAFQKQFGLAPTEYAKSKNAHGS